ncbi:MAG: flagellar basal body P-ring formation chaperone FlgA [Pseudomonadota bacterium]
MVGQLASESDKNEAAGFNSVAQATFTETATRKARSLILVLAVAGLSCLSSLTVSANGSHPHQDIVARVEGAALSYAVDQGFEDVEVRVRPLDPRLRPAACGSELETTRPHSGRALGPVSYGVRCSGPTPWTLYIRAEVTAALRIPVLKASLPRGSILAEQDLEYVTRRVTTRTTDLIGTIEAAVGMELQRPLAAGLPLRHSQISPPELITRGQQVTLVAGGVGFEVRMQGKALASGAEGDRLRVTNLSSGRRLEGIVLADGTVRVP